jgi:ATP-binding cassette subfamily B protein
VTFEGVSFRYPGSERLILENFSLHLPAGRMTAMVGANGAGKSTLIKLIARFYDPLVGRVTLDTIDVRDLSLHDLRRHITIMFQFPMRYAATAARNIELGDLQASQERERIEAAGYAAGFHETVQHLPQGYDTPLVKWLGGVELSGGEWQRLALARASLRQAQIVILDEPTSSMDSWAEIEWLDQFRTLVAGCTVVLITHRFTTARQADIIHVMEAGQIVETGSHEALLALDGRYAESWYAQMLPSE